MLSLMESVAARLLRDARKKAGLSARALAIKAQVPPSTVSRIESGQVDPTIGMLQRLLDAVGSELRMSAEKIPSGSTPAIAELADAWKENEDRPDWTRLRAFLDYLALNPGCVERSLIRKPPHSKSDVLDAMLAGIAQKVAEDHDLRPPTWTSRVPSPKHEWLPFGTDRMRSRWRELTPPQLLQRRIVLDGTSLWRDYENVGV
jgi:transcriptional regulator with XRE-family HTH domain